MLTPQQNTSRFGLNPIIMQDKATNGRAREVLHFGFWAIAVGSIL
jgi:hypothetical protein